MEVSSRTLPLLPRRSGVETWKFLFGLGSFTDGEAKDALNAYCSPGNGGLDPLDGVLCTVEAHMCRDSS